jgi:hypothetical protein
MVKVRYFSKGERSYPSSRYRAFQFREALRDQGVELCIEPLFGDAWMSTGRPGGAALRRLSLGLYYAAKRLVTGRFARRGDLLVIEQELVPLLPVAVERLLLGSAAPVVIELDDAHHLVPYRQAKMTAWFNSADAVIVGNEVLGQAVRRAGGRPLVVPTCVDLDHYPKANLASHEDLNDHDPLRLVWVGLPANIEQLLTVREGLEPLIEAARVVAWSEDAERREMSLAHVGLMPLPHTAWAAGKCALKLLQYQAAGLAAVASPVGMNATLATRGSVLLADQPSEWADRLISLRSMATRKELASRGRLLVEESYSVQHWAPKLALMYRSLVNQR